MSDLAKIEFDKITPDLRTACVVWRHAGARRWRRTRPLPMKQALELALRRASEWGGRKTIAVRPLYIAHKLSHWSDVLKAPTRKVGGAPRCAHPTAKAVS